MALIGAKPNSNTRGNLLSVTADGSKRPSTPNITFLSTTPTTPQLISARIYPAPHNLKKMLAEVNAAVDPLQTVLENGDWKRLKSALHSIPTRVDTARAVETVRVTTDLLIEECAFSTAFERAFVARRALHNADIASWMYSALSAVHPSSLVARRLVTLVESLATTEAGRTRLGRAKVVDALVIIWKRAGPRGSHVPAALCALCSGHIDNISRVMRIGGVSVAESTIRLIIADGVKLDTEQRRALECTLLLFGLLCICIPDKRSSDTQLVPLVRDVLSSCRKLRERSAITHAINIIGNTTECWRKEGRGFSVIDGDELAKDLVDTWSDYSRNRRVVGSSAWALTGLIRTSKLVQVPIELEEILGHSSKSNASVRALREALKEFKEAASEAPIVDEALACDDTSVDEIIQSHDLEVAVDFDATCGVKRRRDAEDNLDRVKRARTSVLGTPQRPVFIEKDDFVVNPTPTRPQDIDFDEEPLPLKTSPKKTRSGRSRTLPVKYTETRA